jgi:hypothetical protein
MDPAAEVYKIRAEHQNKYVYFLLAAAGAGIALSVNQTQNASLRWSQIPLAGAVASWAFSFFAGCRHLQYVGSSMYANADYLRIRAGQHPNVGTHPEKIAAAASGILQAISDNNKAATRHAKLQFYALVAGAALFVGWHIWEMALRTVSNQT